MKYITSFIIMFINPAMGRCCISCNKELQLTIIESSGNYLFSLLIAFLVLIFIILYLIRSSSRSLLLNSLQYPYSIKMSSLPLTNASIVLGIGLGGFTDGILLHQILQWHEMLTVKIPPDTILNVKVNMFWDGIFHLFMLATVLVGLLMLWKLLREDKLNVSGNIILGGLLMGWGIFNIVEGLLNHHIFKFHNVREQTLDQEFWNYSFLIFSTLLIIAGKIVNKRPGIVARNNYDIHHNALK